MRQKTEAETEGSADKTEKLIFDPGDAEYISAAWLHTFIKAQKAAGGRGRTSIKNVSRKCYGCFYITGLADIFAIE